MTTKDLTKLCVFLLGLYLLPNAADGLLALPMWLEALRSSEDVGSRDFYYGTLALAFARFAFVLTLVFGASYWAQLLFGGSRDVALPRLARAATEEVLAGLVGLLLVILAVVEIPEAVVAWYVQPAHPLDAELGRRDFLEHLPQRARLLLQIGIGLWLLLGSRGLVSLWRTIRTGGQVKGAA